MNIIQPTFAYENALPRIPLPTLEQSCGRFLDWCRPLLTPAEQQETAAAVAAFGAPASPAHAVQRALEAYAADPATPSWLEEFWRSRYLGRRDRIALNANFFFLLHDGTRDQATRAAELVATAVAYQLALAAATVPPSMQRGAPLSMEGNRHLFSCTRIPGREIDTVRSPHTAAWPGPTTERHIVVLHHGAPVRLDVIGPQGVPHTIEEIAAGVRAILASSPERGQGVGALTTLARADWADVRERLVAAGNAPALDTIERALFCLCLEDTVPASPEEACAGLLAGDARNRWFDKSVSFIVFANGTAGINGEHCLLDGTNVIELVDAACAEPAQAQSAASGARPQGSLRRTPIELALDDAIRARIEEADRDFAAYASGNAMLLRTFDGVGSDLIKALGVSPDAYVQLAVQLAHRRAKGLTGATYESVSTRRFYHGRTEAMRVVTPECVAWVDAMVDPAINRETRRAAFSAAAAAHVARAKACQAGEAPEQHLWELQLLAARRGLDLPQELYASPGWRTMRDDYLSTSAVPSANIVAFGFGATSLHCIGLAYLLGPTQLSVYLATPREVGEQMTRFADELARALHDVEGLLS